MAGYRAAGPSRRRTDRLPPGEPTGDTHGTLGDYIRGCRCEECREANRQKAREHRERVKAGTTQRHVPARKEPKAPTVKSYMGSPALGDGWEVFGAFTDADGVRWLMSAQDEREGGWRTLKIAAQGRASIKANYWGSFRVEAGEIILGREKDLQTLRKHRSELWSVTMAGLRRTLTPPA